jgi:hypothetical protein
MIQTNPQAEKSNDMTTVHQKTQPQPAEVLRSIHRGEGATVVFHGKDGKEALGALSAADLAVKWSAIAGRIESGCYFSINSAGTAYPTRKPNATGLFASRKRRHLKFLNALFVDIDRHGDTATDLDFLTASLVGMAQDNGLPVPTWTVKSGRGAWALWVFDAPLRSTPETLNHWQLAAGSLADYFTTLGADRAASVDASRIMRVPGSRNHNAEGFRVKFTRTGPEVDFYQIAKALGVTAQPTPLTTAEQTRREKNPAKVKAARARWKRTYLALEKLIQMRGKFFEGSRSWIVFYMAQAMRRAAMDSAFIKRRCTDIGLNSCVPALDVAEITRKIKSGENRPPHGKYTSLKEIARRFAVSQSELEKVPELTPKKRPEPKGKKIRAAIFLLIAELGYVPKPSELLSLLFDLGLSVCRTSLWKYMRDIGEGAQAPPPRPGLSPSAEDQPQKPACSFSAARKNLGSIHVLAAQFKQKTGRSQVASRSIQ